MAGRSGVLLSAIASLAALLTGCGGTNRSPTAPSAGGDDTTLGVGDVFDIRVYGESELTNQYRVERDGTIDFPFIGAVTVSGQEPNAVARSIAARLRGGGFFRSPQVSVFVREYNSKRLTITGAVQNPGAFPVQPGMGIVQAIGLAGGFTPLANRNGAVVTRRIEGTLHRFAVPAGSIAQGEADDFMLQAGDIVYVPERMF